jgi:uncharacterized RDD family membrane protein YckC
MEHTHDTEIAHESHTETKVRYAGFWRRFLAYLLDSIIIGAAGMILTSGSREEMAMSFASIVAGWLYFSLMESSKYQATLGKMALTMKVTDESGNKISFGRATGRHFAKILSAITLGIGYLMIVWTKKKQGLHDKLAHTIIVRTKEISL